MKNSTVFICLTWVFCVGLLETGAARADEGFLSVFNYADQQQTAQATRETLVGARWSTSQADDAVTKARHLLEAGQYTDSIEMLEEAVATYRISEGPDALLQLHALVPMLNTQLMLARWTDIEATLSEIMRVYAQNFDRDHPAFVDALQERARWHLLSYYSAESDEPLTKLYAAYDTYAEAIQLISRHSGSADPRLPGLLHSLAAVAYVHSQAYLEASGDKIPVVRKYARGRVAGQRDYEGNRFGYSQGKDALEGVVELAEYALQTQPEPAAGADVRLTEAILGLADWHLAFGYYKQAMDTYEQAWQTAAGWDPQQRDALFSQAVMVPRFEVLEQAQQTANLIRHGEANESVQIAVSVNRFGKSSNYRIINNNLAEQSSARFRIQRRLHESMIRPNVLEGRMQPHRDVLMSVSSW